MAMLVTWLANDVVKQIAWEVLLLNSINVVHSSNRAL